MTSAITISFCDNWNKPNIKCYPPSPLVYFPHILQICIVSHQSLSSNLSKLASQTLLPSISSFVNTYGHIAMALLTLFWSIGLLEAGGPHLDGGFTCSFVLSLALGQVLNKNRTHKWTRSNIWWDWENKFPSTATLESVQCLLHTILMRLDERWKLFVFSEFHHHHQASLFEESWYASAR